MALAVTADPLHGALHRRFATFRLLGFGVVVALALLLTQTETLTPALGFAALLAIAVAIWHGALDAAVAPAILVPRLGPAWLRYFALGYIGLAGAVALVWWALPEAALPAFLLYSAWHFGTESVEGRREPLRLTVAFATGALPLAAACRFHPAAVSNIFAMMLRDASFSFALAIARFVGLALWPALLLILLGSAFQLISDRDRRVYGTAAVQSFVLAALEVVLFWRCNPLVAFAVFFCAWHTPEHLQSSSEDGQGRLSLRLLVSRLRTGAFAWLVALAALATLAALGPHLLHAYVADTFVVLSALTVPHMALHQLRVSAERTRSRIFSSAAGTL